MGAVFNCGVRIDLKYLKEAVFWTMPLSNDDIMAFMISCDTVMFSFSFIVSQYLVLSNAYLGHCLTSMMELFCENN